MEGGKIHYPEEDLIGGSLAVRAYSGGLVARRATGGGGTSDSGILKAVAPGRADRKSRLASL